MRSVRWLVVCGVAAVLVAVTAWLAYRYWTRPPSIVIERTGGYEGQSGEFGGYIAGEDTNGRPQFMVVRYLAAGASAKLPEVEIAPDPDDPQQKRFFVDNVEQPPTWDFVVYLSTDRKPWTRLDLSRERAAALYNRMRTMHGSEALPRMIREEILPLAP